MFNLVPNATVHDTASAMLNIINSNDAAVRIFAEGLAHHELTGSDVDTALPAAFKAMRREDGPSGARALCRAFRAEHFHELVQRGFDRISPAGELGWGRATIELS